MDNKILSLTCAKLMEILDKLPPEQKAEFCDHILGMQDLQKLTVYVDVWHKYISGDYD